MAGQTRLTIAKPDILKTLRNQGTCVFTRSQIETLLRENRDGWRLAQATTTNQFLDFLATAAKLRHQRFDFPGRPTSRYVLEGASSLEIVQSLKPEGYFTHYTAMHLHGLTDQIPMTIYLNFEQNATGGGGQLTQGDIDQAFKRKCRVSNNMAAFGDNTVVLVNGQNTGRLGVIEAEMEDGAQIRVTNVERTLIDATVRPVYAGGVFEVAAAFERAQELVSINKLVATLKKMNYTYPYHQAIGYYLERARVYRVSQIGLLRQFPMDFDFYLSHAMQETDYIKHWRLFVPKGF